MPIINHGAIAHHNSHWCARVLERLQAIADCAIFDDGQGVWANCVHGNALIAGVENETV